MSRPDTTDGSLEIKYLQSDGQECAATKNFVTKVVPRILEQTLPAFLPLSSAESNIKKEDILAMFTTESKLTACVAHDLGAQGYQKDIPSTHLLLPSQSLQLGVLDGELAATMSHLGEQQTLETKFIILGSILHQLGHHVYKQLEKQGRNATTVKFGQREFLIVRARTSIVEEEAKPITTTHEPPVPGKEKHSQSEFFIPLELEPGQLVELGAFGFVADFWMRDPGDIQPEYLFHPEDEFYSGVNQGHIIDWEPFDSYKFFKKMFKRAPSITKMLKEDFEPYRSLESERSTHHRVGFGTLSGIHLLVGFNVSIGAQESGVGPPKPHGGPADTSKAQPQLPGSRPSLLNIPLKGAPAAPRVADANEAAS
jgi:hypothetical protein